MIPGEFFDPLGTFLRTILVYDETLMPRRQFPRKSQHAAQSSWYLGAFLTYWARFWGLFRCTSEPSCRGDDFLENHSMRRQFHDTWGVFRPPRHVFKDYFGVRRDPHTQQIISSQITVCGSNFVVPGSTCSARSS